MWVIVTVYEVCFLHKFNKGALTLMERKVFLMTKIFKNSKSVISFVLVFAVLAVSLFTGAVITSEAL